jgi:hypothetical protein
MRVSENLNNLTLVNKKKISENNYGNKQREIFENDESSIYKKIYNDDS